MEAPDPPTRTIAVVGRCAAAGDTRTARVVPPGTSMVVWVRVRVANGCGMVIGCGAATGCGRSGFSRAPGFHPGASQAARTTVTTLAVKNTAMDRARVRSTRRVTGRYHEVRSRRAGPPRAG